MPRVASTGTRPPTPEKSRSVNATPCQHSGSSASTLDQTLPLDKPAPCRKTTVSPPALLTSHTSRRSAPTSDKTTSRAIPYTSHLSPFTNDAPTDSKKRVASTPCILPGSQTTTLQIVPCLPNSLARLRTIPNTPSRITRFPTPTRCRSSTTTNRPLRRPKANSCIKLRTVP